MLLFWLLTSSLGRRFHHRYRVYALCIFSFVLLFAQVYSFETQPSDGDWPYNKGNDCDSLESFMLHDGYKFVASPSSQMRTEANISLQDCLRLCLQNRQCRAINFDGHSCQLIEGRSRSSAVRQIGRHDGPLRSFGICAEKICITDKTDKCSGRPWALEHVPGHHLTYSSDHQQHLEYFLRKEVANVQSITACGQLCLDEENFTCRSALYNGTRCQLSNMNRHTLDGITATDRTETSTPRLRFTAIADGSGAEEVHYLENKCIHEPRKFCDFRQLVNLSLKTVDSVKSNVDSLGECRELCLVALECRSYLYESTLGLCKLSHLTELSTWHINQPYQEVERVSTFEISTCYNVSIVCEPKSMKVQIDTSKLFSGRIYSKSQPKQCVNDVSNQMDFHLSLPYIDTGDEISRRQRCDTRQSYPGNFANDIVLQHNDKVLTSKDLSLGVYCKFDLQNDSIARIDLRIQGEILTDKLKGTAELPDLSLHVVDYHGRDIDEVTIGDLLRVQIRMSNEETYGIFVRNLVAKDSSNRTNNITLIDNKGCPVEMKMMREVRTLDKSSKSLESYLEAFTFTGGSLLLIEAEVETCLDKCRPMTCQVATGRSNDQPEVVTSYGRRRRRSTMTGSEQAERGDVLSMTMLTKSLVILPRHDELSSSSSQSDFYSRALSEPAGQSSPLPTLQKSSSPLGIRSSPVKPSHFEKLRDRKKAAQYAGVHKKSTTDLSTSTVAMHMASSEKDLICFEPLNLLLICTISFCVQALVFSAIFCVLMRSRSMFLSSSSSSSFSCRQPQLVPTSNSRLYPLAQQYSFMH